MKERVVLLVEDNEDDEALTIRALSKHHGNVRVIVARDGAEALDFLFARGAFASRAESLFPHVLLLDLNIPKVNGLQVLKQIRSDPKTRSLPVVILTSSREEQDLVQSYDTGANSYIRKPVDSSHFSEAIKTLGTYWLSLNEPVPRRKV